LEAAILTIPRTESPGIRDLPGFTILVELPPVVLASQAFGVPLVLVGETTVTMRADIQKRS
jgi:hypothetical protein